jgi:hypothetical protein
LIANVFKRRKLLLVSNHKKNSFQKIKRKSMSKKKKKITPKVSEAIREMVAASLPAVSETKEPDRPTSRLKKLRSYLQAHSLMIGIIGFLALGALGAGLKYLDEDARREIARRTGQKGNLNHQEPSFLNQVNPFLPAPTPTPTPQLSKEYIYAGSRLLAVEDANAGAASPADLAVWRSSTGYWWVMGPNGSVQAAVGWGQAGDVVVPGDYDGDGKTDFSVFRPASNTWWVLRSSDNGYSSNNFGAAGDKTAQADFDGDGRTDVAVYRPDQATHLGTWYIQHSSDGGYTIVQFGLDTDLPAPADYDGDGKADLGVWRGGSDKVFYSLNSSNNQVQTVNLGQPGDKVVSADYNGDGRVDYAVYNSGTAIWSIKQNSNSPTVSYQWGAAGDIPVQNDYDGDGNVDIAVWRNSNGNWYIRKSGAGGTLRQEAWGTSGDTPVPVFYRR